MNTPQLRTRFGFVAATLLIAACTAETGEPTEGDDFEGVSPDAGDVLIGGKADGQDVTVVQGHPYSRIELSGAPAEDLWDALELAPGIVASTQNGLDYLYGFYSICVSNGSAAACHVYSKKVTGGEGDYAATLHGPRFNSSASEMFGILAAANGVAPSHVTTVEHGRLLCEKSQTHVWCGVTKGGRTLTLSLQNLGDLGPDYVYEGWLITSNGPVTSGRFDLSSADETVTFDIDPAIADDSTLFVLTIEPAVGDDPAPAATHVVAGEIVDGQAVLTAGHGAALGNDFLAATGGYILATPTTGADTTDNDQGVWFVDPQAGPGPSLDLPSLPEGWVYEGWVVGEDGPVSTGVFEDPAGPDSDGAGPTAGPDGSPPFPGQDFINPPMSLLGGAVVISIEPSPDNSPAPFFMKPLVDGSVENVAAPQLQSMANMTTETFPTGTMSLN